MYASYAIKAVNNLPRPYESNWSNSVVIDFMEGHSTESKSIINVDHNVLPGETTLLPNYPNPFNPETMIEFALPESKHITLKVFSTTGEEVTTLVDKYVDKGHFKVKWDGTNQFGNLVSSGLYFYILQSDDQQIIRKMVLLR